MIIEISVAVIALAFVALVAYVIMTLQGLKLTLNHVNEALVSVRRQVDELGGETRKTLQHANELSLDVQGKLESLDSLFLTIAHVGDALEHKTAPLSVHEVDVSEASSLHSTDESESDNSESVHTSMIADIIEWAALGFTLWQKIKKRRSFHG